jgi:hypothetical protein
VDSAAFRSVTHSSYRRTVARSVSIQRGDRVYVEKKGLPAALLDRLIRLAAFQNPEFYSAQAMRFSTFAKPRVIACAEDLDHHIALSRGLPQELLELFESHGIIAEVSDHRFADKPIEVKFHGELRPSQKEAMKALLYSLAVSAITS